MVTGTLVALLGGFVVLAVAWAVARRRPEREAEVVFHGVFELIAGVASIAICVHILLSDPHGVAIVIGLIGLGFMGAAVQAFTRLRAIRAEEKAAQ